MKTTIMVILILVGSVATAQQENLAGRNYDEAREAQIEQKVQHRLYPGGKDESDLKVQIPLVTPVRKMAPTGAAAVEPSSAED